ITWAFESQMDSIAEKLKMDPLDIRLRNAFETGDISQSGQVLKAVGVKECLRKAADQIGWNKQRKGDNRGVGIACMHKWQATHPSHAVLKVNEDGTMDLMVGSVEIGQGCDTIFSQIVAEELEVPIDSIKVAARDTEYTPYCTATTGSGTTFSMGNAVMRAARDIREQCLNLACYILNTTRDELVMDRGGIFIRSAPERVLTFGQLSRSALHSPDGQLIGKGAYSRAMKPFDPEIGQGWETVWQYAAQAVEVEVDPKTGLVTVLRVAAAHDVGKAINITGCQGQIEGGVVMGLGYSLWEDMLREEGKILYPNLTRYKIATAVDIPEVCPIIVEEAHDEGPYGAKGLGEPVLAPTAAAIGNAIYNAVGVRVKTLPLTPERVLAAIKGVK
ncbi:xanthine dehydrogenase family protein molybdopterin-binding subunit, partial [Chloroflexota bacterium]